MENYLPKRFYLSLPQEAMAALREAAEEANKHPKKYAAELVLLGLVQRGFLARDVVVEDGHIVGMEHA